MEKNPIQTLESYLTKTDQPFSPVHIASINKDVNPVRTIHSHNFFQVILIDRGTAEHTIEYEKPVIMNPSSISVLFPGQLHKIMFSPDCQGMVLMFDEIMFCSDILKNELKAYNENLSRKLNFITRRQVNYPKIRMMIDRVSFLYNNITPIRREQIRFYIKILLLQLIEDVHEEILTSGSAPSVNLYARYKELINGQYIENKTVAEYARQLGITTKKLNQVCKAEARTTALAVIHERVLIEARRLLLFSGESIKEIAFTLGFTSPSAFNRFIHSLTGKTPNELKSNMSQNDN